MAPRTHVSPKAIPAAGAGSLQGEAVAVRGPIVPAFLLATRDGSKPRNAKHSLLPRDVMEMLEHIRILHPKGSDGYIVLSSKWHGTYRQFPLIRARGDIPCDILRDAQFVSMNRFSWSRKGDALCSVGHAWLEFDPYAEDKNGNPLPYREMPLKDLQVLLTAAITAAGVPAPSYWTRSGRGLHAAWACEALPGEAAGKVQRVMDALYGPTLTDDGSVPARRYDDPDRDAQENRLVGMWMAFRDAGLDRGTQDSSRVLRIWGSYNQASDSYCERLWPDCIDDIKRCRFDDLADSVLPITSTELRRRLAERAPWKAQNPRSRPQRNVGRARQYAGTAGVRDRMLADLMRLHGHRGGIAKGHRHCWLFLVANCHAHIHGGNPETWAALYAHMAGLTVPDALDCLQSLGRRMRRHEAGETSEYKDEVWNVLFHHSGAKMADLLGVTQEEADAAGLNLVRPGKARSIPPRERQAAKRIRDGAVPRADRADAKFQAGRQGLAIRSECGTADAAIEAIRVATGRGRTWAIEAMKLAAAAPAEPLAEPVAREPVAVEPVETVIEPSDVRESEDLGVRFPSRFIGGSAPGPAPLATAEVDVGPAPYPEPKVRRISDISVMIEVAPDVGYVVIDDPKDRFHGRVVLSLTGEWTSLPEHLEPLAVPPPRKVRQPRPVRAFTRRRPIADAPRSSAARRPMTPQEIAASAEDYRRASGR